MTKLLYMHHHFFFLRHTNTITVFTNPNKKPETLLITHSITQGTHTGSILHSAHSATLGRVAHVHVC